MFKFSFLFLFIFLISLGSATTLSMSPTQLNFQGETGKQICNEFLIKVNNTENLLGKTLWATEGIFERKLSSHNLEPENLGLTIAFPVQTTILNQEKKEICIVGKNSGNYHGILLYKIENKPVQVGIWLNVTFESTNSFTKITGNIVGIGKEAGTIKILGMTSFILLGILLLLLVIPKRKRENEFGVSK